MCQHVDPQASDAPLRGPDFSPVGVSPLINGPSPQRLLVISHVVHYCHQGRLYAYGPYAREIDIWADLFREVLIAAPTRHAPAPGDALAFTRPNITVRPLKETGGKTLRAKIHQLVALPRLVLQLIRAMLVVDAVHVRCPGNVGLLGALLAPLFHRHLVAKYAGQWNGYAGERWSVRLQRRVLRSLWWGSPVTVYGRWPHQPSHVVPFFTSMMTRGQVGRAVKAAAEKVIRSPLRVLFSGRLVAEKRVWALLEAVKLLTDAGIAVEVTILGDGLERARLEDLASCLGISAHVRFVGALAFDRVLAWYEWAHCLVLPSRSSEGWPKAISEAMCHGVTCIAVEHGHIGDMLNGRGILLRTGSPDEIAGAIEAVARNPERFSGMIVEASLWSRQHSLEGLREALAKLLSDRWKVRVPVIERVRI